MYCSECKCKMRTVETRQNFEQSETYRKNICPECGAVIYSVEFESYDSKTFTDEWNKANIESLNRKRAKKILDRVIEKGFVSSEIEAKLVTDVAMLDREQNVWRLYTKDGHAWQADSGSYVEIPVEQIDTYINGRL